MPLTQVQCTNCEANLTVDSAKDTAVCGYCGSTFIAERAAQNLDRDLAIEGGVLKRYKGNDKKVSIPDIVKVIASRAFCGNLNIESIYIPQSVGNIENHAFYGCTSLMHVEIAGDMVKIEGHAFEGCSSIDLTSKGSIYLYFSEKDAFELPREAGQLGQITWFLSTIFNTLCGLDMAEMNEEACKIRDAWLSQGLCGHCGGKYGLIKQTCKSCGKSKY